VGDPIRIEVFSDLVCPWCYIGKRRFDAALRALGQEPDAPATEVVSRPFQLDPHAPRDRAEPVLDVYARKFGGAERAAEMAAHVSDVARAEGLEFHLDKAVRPNTADAHRLLWWALHTAGAPVQLDLEEQLMAAYFTDGENLGDPDVLVARAEACGLGGDAVRRALVEEEGLEALAVGLQHAADLGITAVPTFVVDSRWAIPGAQEPDFFVRALRRVASRADEPR
jgi:predicted DsbA family dithiol-disulfide isomerase